MAKPKSKANRKNKKPFENSGDGGAEGPAKKDPSLLFGIPKNRIPHLILFFVIAIGGSYFWIWISNGMGVDQYTYEIVAEYDHDSNAFTQGLLYEYDEETGKGVLYESTGQYKESELRKIDLKTGEILKRIKLDDKYFGEGLTYMNGKFYQLTWKENKCFVYDKEFKKINEFEYDGEGWGLTNDDRHLIMSNGTSTLTFRDPETFEEVKKITVRYGRDRKNQLNELEFVSGKIFANVLNQDFIFEIDPNTGNIDGEIDLRSLVPKDQKVDVLNGIALNSQTGHFLVTGKLWPKVYEIKRELKDKSKKSNPQK